MNTIASDLLILEELRHAGSLSQVEFERAKAKLLNEVADAPERIDAHTESRMRRLEIENQLLRVEQNWISERERLMIPGKNGHKTIPSAAEGVMGGIFIAVIGVAVCANIRDSPFGVLLGFLCVIIGILYAWGMCRKAEDYGVAETKYEADVALLNKELSLMAYQPDNDW